jgi:hypothetical protein
MANDPSQSGGRSTPGKDEGIKGVPQPSSPPLSQSETWSYDHDGDAYDPEWACTHCGGDGLCWDGADPLGDCPDEMHACHACGGSGKRKDQRVF